MKCFYLGLQPLVERYTYQLEEWNRREFARLGMPFIPVYGQTSVSDIKVGSVLDAYGRTEYAMTQMAELTRMLRDAQISNDDVLFFEDMFTPGLESLPYIVCQTAVRPRVYVRCLAQTIDPDDFVHRTGMAKWMRHFEKIADHVCTMSGGGILVASEEMVPFLKVAEFEAPIYVTGLPFGKAEVQERVDPQPWESRDMTVCFAARWDSEKQPQFFIDVAEWIHMRWPDIKFKILTGSKELRSDSITHLEALGRSTAPIEVCAGLSKNEYYAHLANSKVLFNCALQDWVSNTVSEADALGCMTIYPAYRSFPEVFANDYRHMYLPWSVSDAATKVYLACIRDDQPESIGRVSDYQDKTVERTIKVFLGDQTGERNTLDYRKHVAVPKY